MPNPKRRHSKARTVEAPDPRRPEARVAGRVPAVPRGQGAAPDLPALRLLPRPPGARGRRKRSAGPCALPSTRWGATTRPRVVVERRGRGGAACRCRCDARRGRPSRLRAELGAPSGRVPARHPSSSHAAEAVGMGEPPAAGAPAQTPGIHPRGRRPRGPRRGRRPVQRGQHRRDRAGRPQRRSGCCGAPSRPALAATVPTRRGRGRPARCRRQRRLPARRTWWRSRVMGTVFARVGLGIAEPRGRAPVDRRRGDQGQRTDARGPPAAARDAAAVHRQRRGPRPLLRRGRRGGLRRVHRQRRDQGQRGHRRDGGGAAAARSSRRHGRRGRRGWPWRRSSASGARVDYSEYGGAPLLGVGGPVRRRPRPVVGEGRAQRHRDGAPVRRARGCVPRVEQELWTAAGDVIVIAFIFPGTGIAEGRHGQGARRRLSRSCARRWPRPTTRSART